MGKSHRAESAPAQRRTTYAPGDCAAVLAPGLAIVLRARADAPLVAQLWEEVSAGGDVARVLPLLTSDSDAAHFALLAHGASGAVALVRGGGVVTVTNSTFSHNSATQAGGGMYAGGAGGVWAAREVRKSKPLRHTMGLCKYFLAHVWF